MSSKDAKIAEMNAAADAHLAESGSFEDIPMDELMDWADLPPIKEGEPIPDWRRRLEEPEGWRELPLFMTKIDENSENPAVAALADVLYNEVSPEELAETCKSKGNQAMKQAGMAVGGTVGPKGCYRTALEFYTEGIHAKSPNQDVVVALLANRAQVHLALENYGHCVADCQDVLHIKEDVKCCFRAAKACNFVKKPDRAIRFIERGLRIPGESGNKALLAQKKVTDGLFAEIEKKKTQANLKKREAVAEWMESVQLLVDSGIRVGKSEMLSSHWAQYGAKGPRLEDGELVFSLLMVYDEYNQSDFVQNVALEHSLADHLCEMFPPTVPHAGWDEQKRYNAPDLTDYVCPGFLPTFHVLPKDALYAQQWRAGEY
eukprot:gene22726-34801_t